MLQRLSRWFAIVVGMGALGYMLGYAARVPQLRIVSTGRQAWAVFALGLIAATVLLFRAARVGEAGG